jgi:hypothetical protein
LAVRRSLASEQAKSPGWRLERDLRLLLQALRSNQATHSEPEALALSALVKQ